MPRTPRTTPYYLAILGSEQFRKGRFDTGFVDAHPELADYSSKRRREDLAAVLSTAIAIHAGL
jgi:pyruvate carboxylase subunit A